jgi:hypothetical protein
MKYLLILFALMAIGFSMLAPKQMDLFPDRPYSGAYGGN